MTVILRKHIAGPPACQEPSATAAAAADSSNLKITFNLLILNSFGLEINFEDIFGVQL